MLRQKVTTQAGSGGTGMMQSFDGECHLYYNKLNNFPGVEQFYNEGKTGQRGPFGRAAD